MKVDEDVGNPPAVQVVPDPWRQSLVVLGRLREKLLVLVHAPSVAQSSRNAKTTQGYCGVTFQPCHIDVYLFSLPIFAQSPTFNASLRHFAAIYKLHSLFRVKKPRGIPSETAPILLFHN